MGPGEALGIAVVSRMLFTVADVLLAAAAALSGWWLLRRQLRPDPPEQEQA
jgi:hypothetical protein